MPRAQRPSLLVLRSAVLQGIEYEELLDTHLNMIGFCRVSADVTHTSYRPYEGDGPVR